MSLLAFQLAFIDGIGFDPFFRGFLSVLVGVVVLIGGTYLIIATNTGTRSGFMIAMAGLFGWMFLMGIIWTVYGIGWRGTTPTWHLVEINVDDAEDTDDGLLFSEVEGVPDLAGVVLRAEGIDDPDEAQGVALEQSRTIDMGDWRYLPTSDSVRGEAQASADAILLEEHVYEAGEYLPLQFGGFARGGKPVLEIDEDANFVEEQISRVGHFFNETLLHPVHSRELMVIQTQAIIDKPSLPGQPPPLAEVDPDAPLISVVMDRDRGGPIPSVISGLRFTPFMFTIFNGLVFLVLAWSLHNRDRREAQIRAAAA
ncbi:MAG: hypothetical protein OER95_13960 [Acidimicrobiia bacterium]|nr:hypothetical protein [Acidimicrobiia bacterium]